MKTVKIMFEIMHKPIWIYDEIAVDAELQVVEEDSIIISISEKITKLYDSYYQFGDDEGCWFNEQKEKDNKKIMLSLLNQLIERLNEINDGTFIIEDIESERLKNVR